MLYLVVAVITFALIMLGTFAKRKFDFRIGRGIGDANRKKWGFEEEDETFNR